MVVSLHHLQSSAGMWSKSQLKLEDRAEADTGGARLVQSQPSCLLGTGPHMWHLPNLSQEGFGNILSGIDQPPHLEAC